MISKEEAKQRIEELVERYAEQASSYSKAEYNETMTRRDFIDPFFKALGWDMDNSAGYAEAYREVIHEDKLRIKGVDKDQVKAPDYAFRLSGGKRLFFVEAKKPSVLVKEDVHPAYQVRRYGWSAKLAVSIVTDFQEFAVYDCTKKPSVGDKASVARTKYITYKDYINEFDFLWDTFSKEKVLKGSFDKYIQSTQHKRGTATVDKAFLESLDGWRTLLAQDIARNNKQLDEDELNFAVQQIIDRIIFLRIAEDRSVEPYGKLKNAVSLKKCYDELFTVFRQADDKYNSGLFDFKKDKISKDLTIDDKTLKTVVNDLYYPNSPYEFSVLAVEILGSAYEQFLGKVIRLDASHRARIEEKPEVRKAGGVYYTPQYIVEYIVQHTVGALVDGKTPAQVSKLKIVDPACGSGSFLLGAYQFLLDWHKYFYAAQSKKQKELTPDGRLTTEKKKEILLNNIYGVDLDANAVEVTKLSLLLKCMEGETEASIATQLRMFNERVLPTLDANIKDGNSLVDTDYYDSQLFNDGDRKVKPFNWQKQFPEVFRQGGFDAVIGNPPYVRSQHLEEHIKSYLSNKFATASYQPDLFAFFVEQGIRLLVQGGKLGFIIPNGILTNTYYAKSRQNILNSTAIDVIVDLKDRVFEGASVDTSIFILTKESNEKKRNAHSVQIGEYAAKVQRTVVTPTSKIAQLEFFNIKDNVFNTSTGGNDLLLVNKIRIGNERLGNVCTVKNGMKVRKNYVSLNKGNDKFKRFLLGASIKPYLIDYRGKWVCYDKSLESKFSNQAFRDEEIFLVKPKMLVRQVMGKDRIFGTIDKNQFYVDQSVYILFPKKEQTNLAYLLAIVNSKLMNFFFSKTFSDRKETFPKIKGDQLSELPIKVTNPKDQTEKSLHDEIVTNVEALLKLNEELKDAKLQTKITQIQSRIQHHEQRVNELVYKLYDLTPEEIALVESNN